MSVGSAPPRAGPHYLCFLADSFQIRKMLTCSRIALSLGRPITAFRYQLIVYRGIHGEFEARNSVGGGDWPFEPLALLVLLRE